MAINQEKTPNLVELEIDSQKYTFQNNQWDKFINEDQFVFFDNDFIAKNIHINKERKDEQGQQSQNSTELLISIDKKAISLFEDMEQKKKDRDDKKGEIFKYKEQHQEVLDNEFQYQECVQLLESKKVNIVATETEYCEENNKNCTRDIKSLEEQLAKLQKNKNKADQISHISDINFPVTTFDTLTIQNNLNQLSNFNIQKSTIEESQRALSNHIIANKEFFETGFAIRERQSNKHCPFCRSENEEESIRHILEIKNKIFNDSYNAQVQQFNDIKSNIVDSLTTIIGTLSKISVSSIFNNMEHMNAEFQINGIYLREERAKFDLQFEVGKTRDLLKIIQDLSAESNQQLKEAGEVGLFFKEIQNINQVIVSLQELIRSKNIIIQQFRETNKIENIDRDVQNIQIAINKLKEECECWQNFHKIKEFLAVQEHLNNLEKELKPLQIQYDNANKEYKQYCGEDIFQEKLEKMQNYLERFNLDFRLKNTSKRGAYSVTPFQFQIIDKDYNERTLRDGISDGELQAISIAFFLSFLDSQNLKDKVIFWDDPISSLDNSNLKNLVDILYSKRDDLPQMFIFTHHITFYKFLYKKFEKRSDKNAVISKFIILKNKEELGGSFYCHYGDTSIISKLKGFECSRLKKVEKHNKYQYEVEIIKYGQYLRYAVEDLIKNTLYTMESNK